MDVANDIAIRWRPHPAFARDADSSSRPLRLGDSARAERLGQGLNEECVQAHLAPLRRGADSPIKFDRQSSDDLDTTLHGIPPGYWCGRDARPHMTALSPAGVESNLRDACTRLANPR